jgi:NADPH-dependent ferric siderophore reductase
LQRDGAAPGTTTALLDAVSAMRWPRGTVYAWGGAESHTVTAVRTHLRTERGLERDAVSMVGYWRHGESP